MSSNEAVRLNALSRAAELAGGSDQLAAHLGIAPVILTSMLHGRFPVPVSLFLKTVELYFNGDQGDAGDPPLKDSYDGICDDTK